MTCFSWKYLYILLNILITRLRSRQEEKWEETEKFDLWRATFGMKGTLKYSQNLCWIFVKAEHTQHTRTDAQFYTLCLITVQMLVYKLGWFNNRSFNNLLTICQNFLEINFQLDFLKTTRMYNFHKHLLVCASIPQMSVLPSHWGCYADNNDRTRDTRTLSLNHDRTQNAPRSRSQVRLWSTCHCHSPPSPDSRRVGAVPRIHG